MLSQQLHDTLARAVELTETFEAQNRLPIHATSRLRRDDAEGNAASVFNTATLAIVGALDHLTTWYQIVAGDLKRFPLPVFSHYTLACAAYEPALLTLWLLDPGVDSVERIGRGYAAQLRSLEDMRKFQHDAGMTGEAANATSLHERLFAAHEPQGAFPWILTKGTADVACARHGAPVQQVRPADCDRYSGMAVPVLSGHAHGREWVIPGGASESDLEGFDTGMNIVSSRTI